MEIKTPITLSNITPGLSGIGIILSASHLTLKQKPSPLFRSCRKIPVLAKYSILLQKKLALKEISKIWDLVSLVPPYIMEPQPHLQPHHCPIASRTAISGVAFILPQTTSTHCQWQ